MAERPILFSGPMVQAILAGRKTQTRRVLKSQPKQRGPFGIEVTCGGITHSGPQDYLLDIMARYGCPYRVGDLLWVREAWNVFEFSQDGECCWPLSRIPTKAEYDEVLEEALRSTWELAYQVDAPARLGPQKWRPSIHMPRWASRITLHVTAVKVERLQDISEADAMAEGIGRHREPNAAMDGWVWNDPRNDFRSLWSSINGPDSWEANPWVAAYTFERVKP